MRRAIVFAGALLAFAHAACAQDRPSMPPPRPVMRGAVHYGKWVTAAAAIGFTVLAAREHQDADRHWHDLLALCRDDNAACREGPDGRYLNATAEQLYQQTLYFDRRARRRIIAGQVSLLASAALFILDLRNHHDGPHNIPLHGLELTAAPTGDGARVGVRVLF